ncbi:hypothetical protein EYR40_000641 [Pleurotus pulmonarius]|nr:hypothetical protein EYR40_000641 [Pleurotus pulmonarius]
MPFLKLRRLFSRQHLQLPLPVDDEGIFGPSQVYASSSDSSRSPTPHPGVRRSLPASIPEDCDDQGYLDPDYVIFHAPAADPTDFGIAIPEQDKEYSYEWHSGQRPLSLGSFDKRPFSFVEKGFGPSPTWSVDSEPEPVNPHLSILKLPDEVLRQVFLSYGIGGDSKPSARCGPLFLGQICRKWRAIVHSTPELWSSLTILAGDHVCVPRMPLLKAWLNRSKNCSLNLTVVYDGRMAEKPGNFGSVDLVSELILTHSSRWHTMCFNYTRAKHLISMLSRIPPWGLPILHNVEISLRQRVAPPEQAPILSSLLSWAPNLRQLTCRGLAGISQITIPTQLTHLDIEGPLSTKDCLAMLRSGRQLQDCRFHMEHSQQESLDDSPLLVHPLRSLYISSQEHLGDFFDHLILPNLEDLGISARWTSARRLPPWPQRQFISLLSRSSPAIRSFAVRCLPMSDIELLESLLYMSDTLMNLEVYVVGGGGEGGITITETAISALTFNDYHHNLCPKLEQLTLCGCVRAADGLLGGMLASRRTILYSPQDEETHLLKHVEVAFPTTNHGQDVLYFKSLQRGGLQGEVL